MMGWRNFHPLCPESSGTTLSELARRMNLSPTHVIIGDAEPEDKNNAVFEGKTPFGMPLALKEPLWQDF